MKPRMTADELKAAAIQLFGKRGWTSDLAAALKIDRSTVHRYVTGQIPIPGPVEAAVECWLERGRPPGVHSASGRPEGPFERGPSGLTANRLKSG